MTIHDRFAEVGRRVPGFGGVFVDDATLYIYLTDAAPSAAQVAAATQALRDVLGPEAVARSAVQTLPATYSFVQLKAWFDGMADLLALPGVVSLGIDDRQNRLSVGVMDAAAQGAVEAALPNLGIPLAAVIFEQTGPVETEASLGDEIRPFVGGLGIVSSNRDACTLGYSALRGTTSGWVTNSHCTATEGQVDGTVFYQPGGLILWPSERIGTETVDPAFTALPGCPATFTCRRSDSAFIRTTAGVAQTLGAVARPTALGSRTWAVGNTFELTQAADPLVGENVTKVGNKTGRTQGVVTAVGVTFTFSIGPNRALLNQAESTAGSASGDSGSPVVMATTPDGAASQRPVPLAGLHWGGLVQNGVKHEVFSPQSGVRAELGLTKVCTLGIAC